MVTRPMMEQIALTHMTDKVVTRIERMTVQAVRMTLQHMAEMITTSSRTPNHQKMKKKTNQKTKSNLVRDMDVMAMVSETMTDHSKMKEATSLKVIRKENRNWDPIESNLKTTSSFLIISTSHQRTTLS